MQLALSIAWETERPFRLLRKQCSGLGVGERGVVVAYYLFARLWTDLALDARATGRLGFLSPESAEMWQARAREDLGEAGQTPQANGWLEVVLAAQVLESVAEGGFYCRHFNIDGMNESCRPDHMGVHRKGGMFGGHARRQKGMAKEASELAMTLLPADGSLYHDLEGHPLNVTRRAAALALIRTIDQSLRVAARTAHAANWPQGEVALADRVVEEYGTRECLVNKRTVNGLDAVALFLLASGDDPRLPKSTIQVLQNFASLMEKARAYHQGE